MSLLLALVLLANPPDQKARAAALLQKKSFGEACKLFGKLTAANPGDAEAWAGLAACRIGQKRKQEAISAAVVAARLGDPAARRSAYLTLSAAGVEKKLPAPQPDEEEPRCVQVGSSAPCATPLFACSSVEVIDSEETRDLVTESRIGFGLSKEEANANRPKNVYSRSALHGSQGVQTECVLVWVDGCARRAGVVCTTATAGQDQVVTEARELEL